MVNDRSQTCTRQKSQAHAHAYYASSLSELLLGVVALRSGCFSVCILCVSQSELLQGVVAPRSEVLLMYAYYV